MQIIFIALSVQIQTNGIQFKGLLLQARVAGTGNITGWFDQPDPSTNTTAVNCTKQNDAITHINRENKTDLAFVWHSENSYSCIDVEFVYVIYHTANLCCIGLVYNVKVFQAPIAGILFRINSYT